MLVCAPWRWSVRRGERAGGDSADQPDLVAGRPAAGDRAAPEPSAAVDPRLVAGLRGLAHPDPAHARRLSECLGQGRLDARCGRWRVAFARQPDRPGCRGGAVDRRIHPQAAGNAYAPRCPGGDLSRLLRGGQRLPVRRQPARRAVQPAAGHRLAGGPDRPAAERRRRTALDHRTLGCRLAAAGRAPDAATVRVLPAYGTSVVAAVAERARAQRLGREHDAGGYRRIEPLGRLGISRQFRRPGAAPRAALLAGVDLRALRRPALVAVRLRPVAAGAGLGEAG
ncbi:hypothetical protein FQZ97_917470 [compost metagenome]